MPTARNTPEQPRRERDPFLYNRETEPNSTLLPMLIGSLVLIVICMIAVMVFVRGS